MLAAHALAAALNKGGGALSGAGLVVKDGGTADARIQSLLGLGTGTKGQYWALRVLDAGGKTLYTGDGAANLLYPLSDGDMVIYRYAASTEELQGFYGGVADLSAMNYTEASFAPFRTARDAAADLLEKGVFAVTQAELEAAYTELKTAYDALVFQFNYFLPRDDWEDEAYQGMSIHEAVLDFIASHTNWMSLHSASLNWLLWTLR